MHFVLTRSEGFSNIGYSQNPHLIGRPYMTYKLNVILSADPKKCFQGIQPHLSVIFFLSFHLFNFYPYTLIINIFHRIHLPPRPMAKVYFIIYNIYPCCLLKFFAQFSWQVSDMLYSLYHGPHSPCLDLTSGTYRDTIVYRTLVTQYCIVHLQYNFAVW